MTDSDVKPDDAKGPAKHGGFNFYAAGEEVLDRVKSISQQIEQRVRRISEENPSDVLRADETDLT